MKKMMPEEGGYPPYYLAMVLGLYPAILAFSGIFSDIHFQTFGEAMIQRFTVSASVYAAVGFAFGAIWKRSGWIGGIWIGLPLMAVHLFLFVVYVTSMINGFDTAFNLSMEFIFYTLFFGGGIFFACLGCAIGSRLRMWFDM